MAGSRSALGPGSASPVPNAGGFRDASAAAPLRVAQSHQVWLPQTETWLYTQIRSLPPRIESHIICQATQHLDQYALPHIHSAAPMSRAQALWDRYGRRALGRAYPAHVLRAVRRSHAQLLHSHFGPVGWANLGVARRLRLPHLVTFYGIDASRLPMQHPQWRRRYARLFGAVARVLCEGPHMGAALVALGCPPSRMQVHHLGVDLSLLRFQPRQWRQGEPLRVLLAASFREKKGLTYALEALARFRTVTDVEITIIGDAGPEEDSRREKDRILDVISRNGLGPCTRLLGYQPHQVLLQEAYRHHVFLSPSVTASTGDTEGGAPVTILEMAATGMPVVSTTHCDIPGLFPATARRLLAKERDVEGLVNHLRWLVEHPEDWIALVESTRTWIEQEFDANVQGERLADLYREVSRP